MPRVPRVTKSTLGTLRTLGTPGTLRAKEIPPHAKHRDRWNGSDMFQRARGSDGCAITGAAAAAGRTNVQQGRGADPFQELHALSPTRRSGANVASDLQRCPPMGEGDSRR